MTSLASRTSGSSHGPEPRADADPSIAVRRDDLVTSVRDRLQRRCGVPAGSRLVIGCSGGADSLALVLACRVLRDRRVDGRAFIEPHVVHVHHHLRDEADADAAFVEDVCRRLDVPLRIEHVHPRDESGGIAAAARRLRYRALASAAKAVDAGFIAVAHHAEDQLETMLMALGRGAGLDGLGAMSWTTRRPLGDGAGELDLVRPLLDVRKSRCVTLCRRAGLSWREDPGNHDARQLRGRLRRDVVPVIETLWPDAAARAAATADLLRAAGETLERELEMLFGPAERDRWDRRALRDQPTAIIAAGLRRAAIRKRPVVHDELGQRQLVIVADAVVDDVRRPRSFDWPLGLRVLVTSREVVVEGGGKPLAISH